MSRAIPKGSIVLVTGVNGYIGSHTADQLLSFGYKVRGTVRDASRCQWVQKFFDEKYGKRRSELAVVAHISPDGAFDEAVKGIRAPLIPNPHILKLDQFFRCKRCRARRVRRLVLARSERCHSSNHCYHSRYPQLSHQRALRQAGRLHLFLIGCILYYPQHTLRSHRRLME